MSKPLFEEFPPVKTSDWMSMIEKDLKGADFEKKLVWKSPEGFSVQPFYRRDDLVKNKYLQQQMPGAFPFVRGKKTSNNNWSICQPIHVGDVSSAAKTIGKSLKSGADAIHLSSWVKEGQLFGQKVTCQKDFDALCIDIDLNNVPIHFGWKNQCPQAMAYLNCLFTKRGANPEKFSGTFEFDPLSEIVVSGHLPIDPAKMWDKVSAYLGEAKEKFPLAKHVILQTIHFHNAGSNASQDLAFILSAAVELINALTERGWKVEDVFSILGVKISVSTSYFMEISFFRSLRLLWSAMAKSYGVMDSVAQVWVHAETSSLCKTIYDPHVNILRETTEAMSAIIGGIDALTVHPWDSIFKSPVESSDRLARNTQLVLREETGFSHCVDPSAGSYYIEEITNSLAQKAWDLFVDLEAEGGFLANVKNGKLAKMVLNSRTILENNIGSRRQTILGSNQYPNLKEKMSSAISMEEGLLLHKSMLRSTNSHISLLQTEVDNGLSWGDSFAIEYEQVTEWSPFRLSESFEKNRLELEAWTARNGYAPRVYLWTFGNLTFSKARATFCTNLYGCAGFDIIEGPGTPGFDENITEIKKLNPQFVVFCSSDPEYAEVVPEISKKIAVLYPKMIRVVAGSPLESMEMLKSSGIQDFVHIKTEASTYLNQCVQQLGGVQ